VDGRACLKRPLGGERATEAQSYWLARNLVDRARDRFAGTIVHVQVERVREPPGRVAA
jgi:hypothetical protein